LKGLVDSEGLKTTGQFFSAANRVLFAVLLVTGSIILFACYLDVIMMSRFHELAHQEWLIAANFAAEEKL
jgi:hypothetical protein